MTLCDDKAVFGVPEVRFGNSIAALLFHWYTNPKRTKKMLFTGQDRMLAQEALNLGIVNEVVGEGEGLRRGLALAEEVALMNPDSIRMTKQAINQTYEIMVLSRSLAMGVDTAIKIEVIETPLRKKFNQILRGRA
jgi:enoyl-CoA hydratase/carnithine racemase